MSKCTKGELEAIGSSKSKFKDAYFIRLKNKEDSFIAKTYGHTGFPAKANAKEIVRRWNAYEEDGLVEELKTIVKDMLSGLAYLRNTKTEPYGFGIDRLEKTGKAALAKS